MGFKGKTISRDKISGLWQQNDIESGEVSVNELNARMADRQTALNDAIQKDWPKDMTSSVPESKDPTLGNAVAEFNKTRSK